MHLFQNLIQETGSFDLRVGTDAIDRSGGRCFFRAGDLMSRESHLAWNTRVIQFTHPKNPLTGLLNRLPFTPNTFAKSKDIYPLIAQLSFTLGPAIESS